MDTTGLYYYNARYYDPTIGTFISPDTIVPNPTNLLDYNRFMYGLGNPVKFRDPSGHSNVDTVIEGGGSCIWGGCYKYVGEREAKRQQAIQDAQINSGLLNTAASVPYLDTPEDVLVATTGCGYSCQAGYEEPAGPIIRAVAAAAIILPISSRWFRTASDTVPLFRAVGPDELLDIQSTGRFNNPPGIEGKYFSTTEAGARQYGNMAEDAFGDPPYTYVETNIPASSIEDYMLTEVDRGIKTIVVPTHKLFELSGPRILPE